MRQIFQRDLRSKRIGLVVGVMVLITVTLARAQLRGVTNYGNAWTSAIAAWLPHFGAAQSHEVYNMKAVTTGKTDFFVCPDAPKNASISREFNSAAVGCPEFQHGPQVQLQVYGMDHGWIYYDAVHRIAFFSKGCCSVSSYILSSGVVPPPRPLPRANLSAVRTHRGVSLGMSIAAVMAVYGRSAAHSLVGAPGTAVLYYSSGSLRPHTNCSQNQIFAFENDRLYYIELMMGC